MKCGGKAWFPQELELWFQFMAEPRGNNYQEFLWRGFQRSRTGLLILRFQKEASGDGVQSHKEALCVRISC